MSEEEICQLAFSGNIDILKVKLRDNAHLCSKADQSGRQPVHWAASGGHTAVVEHLLDSCHVNYDVTDESKWTPLMIAVSAGRDQIIRLLIGKGADVNAVNSTGQCPLHYAASKDRYDIAELLLEHGAHANISDSLGNTPLHRAASKGHLKLSKLLLSYNADPNDRNSEGSTPLHYACEDEQDATAKILAENGASISSKNKAEKTPLDFAKPALRRQLERLGNIIQT